MFEHQNMDGGIVPFPLCNWLKLAIFKLIHNIVILTFSDKKEKDSVWNAHIKVLAD